MPWLLPVLGLLAYVNTLAVPFVFDDTNFIQGNRQSRRSGTLVQTLEAEARPLLMVTLAINYAIDGENAVGYHTLNISVHILAACVLYGLVRRTVLLPQFHGHFTEASPWLALVIASLWMLHPLQTQAVTYVIQRSESMMGLFYLLTLYCTLRGAQSSRYVGHAWFILACLSCLMGWGSKEVIITVPVVLLLYDRTFLAGSFINALRRRWALYVVLVAMSGFLMGRLYSGHILGAPSAGFGIEAVGSLQYAMSQPGVICHYLRLSFWPHPLCLDYLWPPVRTVWPIVVPLLVVLPLLGLTIWTLCRRPWLGFLGAWFFLILAPTSSIVPIADLAVEHRMYLPLAAVVTLVVLSGHVLLGQLTAWIQTLQQPAGSSPVETDTRVAAELIAAIAVVVAVALFAVTVRRNLDYRTASSLWRTVVSIRPFNVRAQHNLGEALAAEGYLKEALAAYEKAIELKPDYAQSHNNIGLIWLRAGRVEKAAEYLQTAVQSGPEDAEIHYNLAQIQHALGQLDEAAQSLERAIQLQPDYPKAHNNLGVVCIEQGRRDEGRRWLEKAIRIDPTLAEAYNNLASLFRDDQNLCRAIELYGRAVELRPHNPKYLNDLGHALVVQGRLDEGIGYLSTALQVSPTYAKAYRNLKRALQDQGDPRPVSALYHQLVARLPRWPSLMRRLAWELATDPNAEHRDGSEALHLAETANRTTSNRDPQYLDTLAAAYAEVGQFEDAVETAEHAHRAAQRRGPNHLVHGIEARLTLYGKRQPFREEQGSRVRGRGGGDQRLRPPSGPAETQSSSSSMGR